ncbi:MAG: type I polyketide synthase, partial [Myxococcota bacterium]|nr:type I polyketide synthase [Myxococcota bacterium]
MRNVPESSNSIAIVGMACEYPDASTPKELFDNVLAGRRAFRRIPDARLPLSVYGSQRADAVDQTYLTKAALIEGYHFDREAFKIVGSTYRQADLTHWLALDVANRALEDAGFKDAQGSPREKTGVVLGNTLTGEFSRAQLMRLRWPYVHSVLRAELGEVVPEEEALAALLEKIESRYKAPFEVFGDESLAGGLSNTIAGRICNYFDFKGGGYTVDGACSSSLLAISQACDALIRGDLDLALAGGVDLSLDPFELVGFSRAGALARQDMRVYDKASAGFWPGEGCGFLVLMREEDVTTQPVYARIRGWGMSSDGAGGISRPDVDGQAFALSRAYARAEVDAGSVGYFEGHGTGTVIGDATELQALTKVLGQRKTPVAIGSIKANIGHTKAAAGIAGSLKAILAVAEGVIPPMPHPLEPHDLVNPAKGSSLYVEAAGAPWMGTEPRRAAVSSMGFGGINTHLVLEEGKQSKSKVTFKPVEPLPISHQESELFIFSANTFEEMLAQVTKVAKKAASLSFAELTDCAGELAQRVEIAPCRAALVASTPEHLLARLDMLQGWLKEVQNDSTEQPYRRISADKSLALGQGTEPPKIGFLFPGQGTVLPASLDVLLSRCSSAEIRRPGEHYLQALRAYGQEALREPVDTAIAQPMLSALNVFALRFIDDLGLQAAVALGHSLGELSALHWAGALSQEALLDLARNRGSIMSKHAHAGGAMASFRASWKRLQDLLQGTALVLAGQNGPEKSVVSGTLEEIEDLLLRAKAEGIAGMRLPVSHAFHSPLIEPCVPVFAEYLKEVSFAPLGQDCGFVSTSTGAPLPTSVDLAQHLVEQLRAPVLFADALKSVEGQVDLWLELGSGQNLATLASGCVDVPCLSLNAGESKVRDLFALVGAAYAFGAPVKWRQLFRGRKHKPLDLDLDFQFFMNPCERKPSQTVDSKTAEAVVSCEDVDVEHTSAQEVLKMLVAKRCELPESMVLPENRFLSDLHLTSIAVSSIAAEACRLLKKPPLVAPSEFANATIEELAKALDSSVRRIPVQGPVLGVDAWLRPFSVDWSEQELARPSNAPVTNGDSDTWFVLADKDNRFVQKVEVHLNQNLRAGGVLLYLGPEQDDAGAVDLLLQAAKHVLEAKHTPFFVLLHHDSPAASIARTLHLEAHSLRTRIIDLSHCQPEPEVVLREIESSAVYTE